MDISMHPKGLPPPVLPRAANGARGRLTGNGRRGRAPDDRRHIPYTQCAADRDTSILPVLKFAGCKARSMVSTFCLLCLGVLSMAIGMVFGVCLGEMKRGVRERLDERHAERMRIARDLHDTLLQSVQALLFRLQFWARDTRIPEESRAEISAVVIQ